MDIKAQGQDNFARADLNLFVIRYKVIEAGSRLQHVRRHAQIHWRVDARDELCNDWRRAHRHDFLARRAGSEQTVSTPLEPRKVDRPFAARWLRMTFDLVMRAPWRFGLLAAALMALDNLAVSLATGYVVQRFWVDRIGELSLAVLWTLIVALARGSDDARLTWQALAQFARTRVWLGALGSASIVAVLELIVSAALHGVAAPFRATPYLRQPGELMASFANPALLFTIGFGPCYFPLLLLATDASPVMARQLADSAIRINGKLEIWLLTCLMVTAGTALATIWPAYGLTNALFLVFMGVFNYVIYRDIFERRAQNLPQSALAGSRAGGTGLGQLRPASGPP